MKRRLQKLGWSVREEREGALIIDFFSGPVLVQPTDKGAVLVSMLCGVIVVPHGADFDKRLDTAIMFMVENARLVEKEDE